MNGYWLYMLITSLLIPCIMIVFGAKIAKMAPRKLFLIIALAAGFRGFAVWVTENPYLILLTYLGSVVWFGLMRRYSFNCKRKLLW